MERTSDLQRPLTAAVKSPFVVSLPAHLVLLLMSAWSELCALLLWSYSMLLKSSTHGCHGCPKGFALLLQSLADQILMTEYGALDKSLPRVHHCKKGCFN